jgi:signal transduction histidine kinase
MLSFHVLRSGTVGINGSIGKALERSLTTMRGLVDRELTDVRLIAGDSNPEDIVVRDLIEDVEVAATMEASAQSTPFSVTSVDADVRVRGDRQILTAVVANLLQNAFKFSRRGGPVSLTVHATTTRVRIEVQDSCGGLPDGKAEELFRPFAQRGDDRSGLGLGLAICKKGVRANGGELRVVNQPTSGWLFVVDLPRKI